jgi:hypothetical protein
MELMAGLYFCCACAENRPEATSARETPARTIRRPSKTRRLKKAECDVDFFFMSGYDVDRI